MLSGNIRKVTDLRTSAIVRFLAQTDLVRKVHLKDLTEKN